MANKFLDARILPHNIDAEQSVLGCVFLDQAIAYEILGEIKTSDFYVEAHKIIFENMYDILEQNKPVDLVTLSDTLENKGLMESVGGIDYLTTLTNIVPSASNFKYYINIIKRDSILRKLIHASTEISKYMFEGPEKTDAINFAEKAIFDISEQEDVGELTLMRDSLGGVIDKFHTIEKDPESIVGLPTGLYELDKILNGLHRTDLVLIAARPGCGKSSLGLNIINHLALTKNASCAIFNLEMPKSQLAQRALCSVAYVDMKKALDGKLSSDEWKALWAANEKLSQAKIYIDDSSLNTPMDILSKCRRLKAEHGLDCVMIDYLQLMSARKEGGSGDNRQQEISEISRNLKIVAKELDVPILLLSQLSREVDKRPDHRPRLSDLRESGAIEQDADIVIFIYRPDMYKDTPESESAANIAEIMVSKHRNGPQGVAKVKWIGSTTTFVNLSKDANDMSLDATAPPANKYDDAELPEIVPIDESDICNIF